MSLGEPTDRRSGDLDVRRLLEDLELGQPLTSAKRAIDPLSAPHFAAKAPDRAAHHLALRQFQQERGLAATGRLDPDTYRELLGAQYRIGDRVLQRATHMLRGDDVRDLQHQLAELGFHHGNVDGIFGPTTEQSLSNFQADYGLRADGVCGPITIRALHNLLPKVTGGSPAALASYAYRMHTGPGLAGRYIVLDPIQSNDELADSFISTVTESARDQLERLGANALLAQGVGEELSATERSLRANQVGAEIYLSLDVASHSSQHAEGVAAYYFGSPSGASQVGRELAGLLQREVSARTDFTDLGEHPRVLETLRATRMPSIHLELGYLSSPFDRARMSDPLVIEAVTAALVAGVERFYLAAMDEHATGTWQIPHAAD
ncbi:peptidoglycan-binding protein [Cumulibacter soli]|uniref:peptidoglycan-binding protein n=1 Tax=Cumulibacter soli TaxID=2546344 RepID=UPI001067D29C|nr:peptidoglycan-binding protein [Cumulibacter soli]